MLKLNAQRGKLKKKLQEEINFFYNGENQNSYHIFNSKININNILIRIITFI